MINVNTNILSISTSRQLSSANNEVEASIERLSTGKKLNHAADGAADISITDKFYRNLSGTKVAQENTLQAVNMLDTADAALGTMTDLTNRIMELSLQSMNGTYSDFERQQMQLEVAKITDEIYRQKNSSKYNELPLFGSFEQSPVVGGAVVLPFKSEEITLQVGAFGSQYDRISLEMGFSLEGFNGDVSTVEKATETLMQAQKLQRKIMANRSNIGANRNHLEGVLISQDEKKEYLSSSYSTMVDVDFAKETANLTKNQILQQSTSSLLSQAKVLPEIALQLVA